MSPIEVRPFRRGDREQLAYLVNVRAAAVIPGMSVSVNTVSPAMTIGPEAVSTT